MVKGFGLESRMTGAGLLGTVQNLAREKSPPNPLFLFRGWPCPRPPWGSTNIIKQRKRCVRLCFLQAPQLLFYWWLSSFLSPYFIMNFFTYYLGCHKERNSAFRDRFASCGQWGNQIPFQVLHQSGWDAGITTLARPRLHCAKAHAAWSRRFLSEVCCIHRFRNQLDGREWALGSFEAPIHACHL